MFPSIVIQDILPSSQFLIHFTIFTKFNGLVLFIFYEKIKNSKAQLKYTTIMLNDTTIKIMKLFELIKLGIKKVN